MKKNGGEILVEALLAQGVDTIFCVPGESYLFALDALSKVKDKIQTITCRHESGAAFMAEAYGKLTGKPGVIFVTRGPGTCNATIGIHTAQQDSTPVVLLIGQIEGITEYRESFQEVDYRLFLSPITKWAAQIQHTKRIPELVNQAFTRAISGRQGPVALSFPEEVLSEEITNWTAYPRANSTNTFAHESQLNQLASLISNAKHPLVIAGGGGWNTQAVKDFERFSDRFHIPVAASFRCEDRLNNLHACYVGELGFFPPPILKEALTKIDLLIVLGARLGDITTQGYQQFIPGEQPFKMVHIYPDSNEIGRVYPPHLGINATIPQFCSQLAAMHAPKIFPWLEWRDELHDGFISTVEHKDPVPGPLDMAEVMHLLKNGLSQESIVCTDAGNFSCWAQRYFPYTDYPGLLGPTNGAMGYSIPAAIAASLKFPQRQVIGIVGDGGCLMTGNEISTALHYGIKPIILVINNNMYGTIRMHQERTFPAQVYATDLTNPDFYSWAKSFGAHTEKVCTTEEFLPAFNRAVAADKIAVIELLIDAEAISTRTTLSAIRNQALTNSEK